MRDDSKFTLTGHAPYRCPNFPACGHEIKHACPTAKPSPLPEAELRWAMNQEDPRMFPEFDVPVVWKVGTTANGRQYVLLDDLRLIQSAHDGHVRDIPGRDYYWFSLGRPFVSGNGTRFRYGYTAYDRAGDADRRAWLAEYKMRLV